jgi:hypothetical protein
VSCRIFISKSKFSYRTSLKIGLKIELKLSIAIYFLGGFVSLIAVVENKAFKTTIE